MGGGKQYSVSYIGLAGMGRDGQGWQGYGAIHSSEVCSDSELLYLYKFSLNYTHMTAWSKCFGGWVSWKSSTAEGASYTE